MLVHVVTVHTTMCLGIGDCIVHSASMYRMCVVQFWEGILACTTPCVTDLYLHSWGLIAHVPGVSAKKCVYTTAHNFTSTQWHTATRTLCEGSLGRLPALGRCACLCLGCGDGIETPTITAVTQACLLRAAAWWGKLSNPCNYHSLRLRPGRNHVT